MADGPLRGVRILDLTHVWAGPLATRILADLGAQVVKIEAPLGRGPRKYRGGLPIGGWLGGAQPAEPWNANAVFAKLQRNKASVALDLKAPTGRETFLELAAVADVVMENFSARAMPQLGLDYEAVAKVNARVVYVSMPGYGTSGPYRDRVAFGPTAESMSGLATVLGYGADEPRNTTMALMDPIAAVHAAAAVVDALRRRERSGRGMRVELSLHEGGVAFCGPWLVETQLGGRVARIGNRHPRMAPHGVYPCAGDDAWVAVACRHDADWRALCGLVGGLSRDADLACRQAQEDQIDAAIARWTRQRSKQQAASKMQEAGVPAGPVNTTPDMTADPQVRARGFFVPLEPSAGEREGASRGRAVAPRMKEPSAGEREGASRGGAVAPRMKEPSAGEREGASRGRAVAPRMKEPSAGEREGASRERAVAPRKEEQRLTPMPGNPIKMAGTSSEDWTPCPRLGAHNRTVLKDWLNYHDGRINALEAAGILVDKPPK